MFEKVISFFKKLGKTEEKEGKSKDTAKERLHLVLMQDRANVSADFLELMKQEIIDVIKKYIEIDESAIDVRLTNKTNEDGTNGAPALYANIPITNIRNDVAAQASKEKEETSVEEKSEEKGEKKEENQIEEKQEDVAEKEDKEEKEEEKEKVKEEEEEKQEEDAT